MFSDRQVIGASSVIRAPLAISLGAIAGALSRYYVSIALSHGFGAAFPFGTFFVNLSGAFAMGWFSSLAIFRTLPDLRLLIAVGLLGSYTTFSSYELDAYKLLVSGQGQVAALYWIGSPILGLLGVECGRRMAQRRS